MLDWDSWTEIYHTLRKKPMRTFLTALGVGWGIFLLIINLGAGKGLENGAKSQFGGIASNSAYIWTQTTSMPYKGFNRGRTFGLKNNDIAALHGIPEVEVVAPRAQLGGYRGANNVARGKKTAAFSIMGDHPVIQKIELFKITRGRFINELDIKEKRKVCVIGSAVLSIMFDGKNPIGDFLKINGIYFQVVGVFGSGKDGERAERDEQTVYIPLTTYQKAFNRPNRVGWFAMLAKAGTSPALLEQKAKTLLAQRHKVHPNDPRAFGSFNSEEEMEQMNMVFKGIRLIAWIFGILTLFAGAIGVSNIMLVTIRERTREIGIRRALGATPWNIRKQIVMEALTLTFLAGISGICLATGCIESLSALGVGGDFFRDPSVRFDAVMISFVVLIVAGVFAGLIPASRAVRMKTIDALRSE